MHGQEVIEITSSIRALNPPSCHALHDPHTDHTSERGLGYQSRKHFAAQRATTTLFDAFWILEIAGLIVSIACLAAIVIILAIHDRQPFSSWTFYLSLNTVVSILATISKATVLLGVTAAISQDKWNTFKAGPRPLKLFQDIDQASRGGMGSLRAIWNSDIGYSLSLSPITTLNLVLTPADLR